MKENKQHLHPYNCNKSMCKTCIFQTNGNQVQLPQERINEIHNYLASFESSHICHTTDKTCYGGLQFQSDLLYRMKIIEQPTVENMLQVAQKYLANNT